MQRLLEENEVEKIDARLKNNALLLACQKIWPAIQDNIESVAACPEDIFLEAAWLMDKLIDAEDNIDATSLVRGVWSEAVSDISKWKESGITIAERYLILSSVFRLVATAFSLHWHSYYNDTLRDAILAVVNEKCPPPENLFERQQQERHQELQQEAFISCADTLDAWVNEYIGNPDYWLTDEIEHALRKRTASVKLEQQENTQTNEIPNAKYARYSFKLTPPKKYKQRISEFLTWLHDELVEKKFITDISAVKLDEALAHLINLKEKNQLAFNAVFSGADTDYHIVWIGAANALGYFINQLESRGVLSWKQGPRKWQVTRNRIWQRKKNQIIDEETGKKSYSYIYQPFPEKAFDKNNVPKDTTKLDRILDAIAPIKQAEDDIEQEFRENAQYESNNTNSRGRMLSSGYRDRSHKANE